MAASALAMLSNLPVELVLRIVTFLPLSSVASLRQTCHALEAAVRANESTVYRAVGLQEGMVPFVATLESCCTSDPVMFPDDAEAWDWKELCRRYSILDNNWRGRGTVSHGAFCPLDTRIMTFFVDEEDRTLLFPLFGTLVVRALESGALIREHSQMLGRSSQHVYSQGYIAGFDLDEQGRFCVRLWRHVEGVRGEYTAHAVINAPPELGMQSHFHMAFPTVAARSMKTNAIMLFDVPTGTLVGIIDVRDTLQGPRPARALAIRDIHVGKENISICFDEVVIIVPFNNTEYGPSAARAGAAPTRLKGHVLTPADAVEAIPDLLAQRGLKAFPDEAIVLQTSEVLIPGDSEPVWAGRISGEYVVRAPGADALPKMRMEPVRDSKLRSRRFSSEDYCFSMSCLSPSGRHIAMLLANGMLCIVEDFARLLREEISFAQVATVLRVSDGRPVKMLWPDERRLLIQIHNQIFVLDLAPWTSVAHGNVDIDCSPSFPEVTVRHLAVFGKPGQQRDWALHGLSWVSGKGVWATCDMSGILDTHEGRNDTARRAHSFANGWYIGYADFMDGVLPVRA